jgi:integrase/recombinase XerD
MRWMPCVVRSYSPGGDLASVVVGHPMVDEFLEFCRARCRPNTIVALTWDLKTFFAFVDSEIARCLNVQFYWVG